MSHVYKKSEGKPRLTVPVIGGLIVIGILFAALPFTQLLSVLKEGKKSVIVDVSLPPPPPPPVQPPPPEEKKREQEKPQLKEKPKPLTLAQLEIALNPGTGNASGSFGFQGFNTHVSALAGIKIFDLKDLDKPPRPVSTVRPAYPYDLKHAGITGEVDLLFIVDDKGFVRRARVESTTNPGFNEPALEAVRQWRFDPGVKDGKKVYTRVRLPIQFNLNE